MSAYYLAQPHQEVPLLGNALEAAAEGKVTVALAELTVMEVAEDAGRPETTMSRLSALAEDPCP